MARELTTKQRRFVEVYDGNGTAAAREAGYAGDDHTLANVARNLLRNAEILEAIRARENAELSPLIASRLERQAFWTSIMRDEEKGLQERLRAAELLGKSEADFTEKLEHTVDDRFAAALKQARERAKR